MTKKREQSITTPTRPRGRPRKPNFDDLVPERRPIGKIHPERAEQLGPPLKPRSPVHAIDENSSYHEFAWEFLRRNRFYQALQDGKAQCRPVAEWGYRWHDKAVRQHGLVDDKPYWESYDEGTPPRWVGLDDFAQRLPSKPSLEPRTETVTLQPGQVLVVFDLAGFIYEQSPLDAQLWAAQTHLEKIATRPFTNNSFSGKPMHRATLLRRLKLFDLLDAGRPLDKASVELGYRYRGKQAKSEGDFTGVAAGLILAGGKGEPVTTAFEDAKDAYDLVYRHLYLDLLRGEKSYSLHGTGKDRALLPDSLIFRHQAAERKSKRSKKNDIRY